MNILALPSQHIHAISNAYGIDVNGDMPILAQLKPEHIAELNNLSEKECMRLWCQWHLGHRSWADEFINAWEAIRKANGSNEDNA